LNTAQVDVNVPVSTAKRRYTSKYDTEWPLLKARPHWRL